MKKLRYQETQIVSHFRWWTASLALAGVVLVTTLSRVAAAEGPPTRIEPVSPRLGRKTPQLVETKVDTHSGWSVGLEGYAGLGTLSNSEESKGHAMAGGVSRARFGFAEIAGSVEVSDDNGEHWRNFGGAIGGFLPFTNWVDFDASVGLASRRYASTNARYGSSGLVFKTTALTLRLGLSDRVIEGLVGPRLGAALLCEIDMKHRDVEWSYSVPGGAISGVSHFGGVSLGLVVTAGFDLAVRADRR
jgi:hypothetical protein